MSTDRELLELAAKAAGIEVWIDDNGVPWLGGDKHRWNPLTDDGDALRLAVKLGISLDFWRNGVSADSPQTGPGGVQRFDSDPYSATRRAIVRAAAEIGRAMP